MHLQATLSGEHDRPAAQDTLVERQSHFDELQAIPQTTSGLLSVQLISPLQRVRALDHEYQQHDGDIWIWRVEALHPLPPYYCLERSSKIFQGVSAQTVSRRISSFLRINSISANYHHNNVECSTFGFLKFVIQLWGDEADSKTVVVEVQRREGCCLRMKKLRTSMFRVIAMLSAENDPQFTAELNSYQVPDAIHHLTSYSAAGNLNGCLGTLETAKRLFRSDCLDQHKLGMECLISSVKLSRSWDQRVSECVSKAIVCGTGIHSDRLRTVFGEYFYETHIGNVNTCEVEPDNQDHDVAYARGSHFGMMHLIALEVLENSLKRVLELRENRCNIIKVDVKSWFWRTCLESLVYNIEFASSRPLEASISSSCLSNIMMLAPEVRHCRRIEERLIPVLVYAHGFGRAHHFKLETESHNLMRALS